MARSLNKVQLIGRLGRDPEMKYLPSSKAFTTFSLATNSRRQSSAGAWEDQTEWHNVVCWDKLAETANEYLRKGSQVFISGRLQTRQWEGKDGQKQQRTEIVADDLILLDPKDEGRAPAPASGGIDDDGDLAIPF